MNSKLGYFARNYSKNGIKVMPTYDWNDRNINSETMAHYKNEISYDEFDKLEYIIKRKNEARKEIREKPTGLKVKCGSQVEEKGFLYCLDFDFDDFNYMHEIFCELLMNSNIVRNKTIEEIKEEVLFEYTSSRKIHFFFYSKLDLYTTFGKKNRVLYELKEALGRSEIELFLNSYIATTPTKISTNKIITLNYEMSKNKKTLLDCPVLNNSEVTQLISKITMISKKESKIKERKKSKNKYFYDKKNIYFDEKLSKISKEEFSEIINLVNGDNGGIKIIQEKGENSYLVSERVYEDENNPNILLVRYPDKGYVGGYDFKLEEEFKLSSLIYKYSDKNTLSKINEILEKNSTFKSDSFESLFDYKKLTEAYIRLKAYFYYDTNALLDIRMDIAKFEEEIIKNENYTVDKNNFVDYIENDLCLILSEKELKFLDDNYLNLDSLQRRMFIFSLEIEQNKFEKYLDRITVLPSLKSIEENNNETASSIYSLKKLFKEKEGLSVINEESDDEIDEQIEKILNNFKNTDNKVISIESYAKTYDAKTNIIIKAPIELHILSTLWVITFGKELDADYFQNSFGHRLDLYAKENSLEKESKIELTMRGDKKTFKPYPTQYQEWRNGAIDEVKHILEEDKENAVLFTLDIKKFFYNTRNLKIEKLVETKKNEFQVILDSKPEQKLEQSKLLNIIDSINEKYKNGLENLVGDSKIYVESSEVTPLPIGLLSSMVLGNYALKKFDELVLKKTMPNYYGRYVDDIILVFKINKKLTRLLKGEVKNPNKLIKLFLEDKIIKPLDETREEFYFLEDEERPEKNFRVQKDKFKFYLFKADESRALLDSFENNIKLNASAFNFLPEEDELINDFNVNALSIQYSGSPLKISSINGLQDDKFKLSVYLAKAISFNKYNSSKDKDKFGEQLLLFFKGKYLLKYSLLWEKLFTYMVTRKDYKKLGNIYKRTYKEIQKINDNKKLVDILKDYLKNSLAMAVSLDIKCLEKIIFLNDSNDEKIKMDIKKSAEALIESNMLRHRYVYYPLQNYLDTPEKVEVNYFEDTYSKVHENYFLNDSSIIFQFDKFKLDYSPRSIHLNEFIIFYFKRNLLDKKHDEDFGKVPLYLQESFRMFSENLFIKNCNLDINKFCHTLEKNEKILMNKIVSDKSKEKTLKKLKVGLGNLYIPEEYTEENLKYNQVLTEEREQKINKILNEAKKEGVDLVILPEVSIPFQWIDKIAEFSRKNNIAIICGVEHIKVNSQEKNIVHNFLATILPFNVTENYKTTYIKFRLKNYYSPQEKIDIEGRDFYTPLCLNDLDTQGYYDLFLWKGIYFTVFNCFELSNIMNRAYFQGYLDLLIASVYNRDTNYFKEILDSTSRDLHCYAIQSNTSQYGNSTIIQPSKSHSKEILNIKGGKNGSLIVDTIDVEALRNFQIKNHSLQLTDKSNFKATPPGYTTSMAWNRINKKIGEN